MLLTIKDDVGNKTELVFYANVTVASASASFFHGGPAGQVDGERTGDSADCCEECSRHIGGVPDLTHSSLDQWRRS